MSNPRSLVFAFLKLDITRNVPCEERLRDGRKMHCVGGRRQIDDPSLNVPPRFATTDPQAFPTDKREKPLAEVASGSGTNKK
jgi:hypothetical protein